MRHGLRRLASFVRGAEFAMAEIKGKIRRRRASRSAVASLWRRSHARLDELQTIARSQSAPDSDPEPRLSERELREQVRALTERVQQLMAENAKLRKALSEAHATGPVAPAADKNLARATALKYRSLQELLEHLPQDLKMSSKGWDTFQFQKVQKWLADHAVGSEPALTLPAVVGKVIRIGGADGDDAWGVVIEIKSDEAFRAGAATNIAIFEWERGVPYTFTCNEAIAKEWDSRRKQRLKVTATAAIDALTLEQRPEGTTNYFFKVRLDEPRVTLPFRVSALSDAAPGTASKMSGNIDSHVPFTGRAVVGGRVLAGVTPTF